MSIVTVPTSRIADLHAHAGIDRYRPRLGDARPLVRQGRVHRHARWDRHASGRRGEVRCAARGLGAIRAPHARNVDRGDRGSTRRRARARRPRDRRRESRSPRHEPDRLSDPAEGARRRFPPRPPAPLAAQPAAAGDPAHPARDRAGASTISSTSAASSASIRPILTAAIGERSGLFSTEYFDEGTAYLAQTGQLYGEAAAAAFGRIYTFGPTFRAEKSKTRRHLTEFWMIEPEVAFYDSDDNMRLQEDFVSYLVRRVPRAAPDGAARSSSATPSKLETRRHAVSAARLQRCGDAPADEGKRDEVGRGSWARRTSRCSSRTTTGPSS